MSRCFVGECGQRIPPTLLMCRRHWAMVPPDLGDAVYREYRRGKQRGEHPSRAWAKAAMAARRHVEGVLRGASEEGEHVAE